MNAADQIDRNRVVKSFLELARLNGPSGRERPVAEFLSARLGEMGFSISFDDAHLSLGTDCGNLFAWWPGNGSTAPPLFLSAHMDTVLPTERLQPLVQDGVIRTDGTTILGADDRAAIAAYLEGVRAIQASGAPCGPIEVVLTVDEQRGLRGARHLDFGRMRATVGYIYDSSGDVGQIILRGPHSKRINFTLEGKAAHLGLAAEAGVSAIRIAADAVQRMRLAKVDDDTVANIGSIHGGELPSIIPDHVEMAGEARSFTPHGLDAQLRHMADVAEAAARRAGGSAHVEIEHKYDGYEISPQAPYIQTAVRAARRLGIEPYFTDTLGGADTNIFIANGRSCVTLGIGFRDIHSFDEHIHVASLVDAARLVTGIVTEHAEAGGAGG